MIALTIMFALVNLLALVGVTIATPGGVTDRLLPTSGAAPAGCVSSFPSRFEISVIGVAAHVLARRAPACHGPGTLLVSVKDGVMSDDKGWTAYIASNFQFQFDNPPQAGALVTAGFSVCPETGYVAIGGTTTFFQCGSGTFSNIYDRHWAPQCSEIRMLALPCGEGAGEVGNGSGNVVGTTMVATTIVTTLVDGQPQIVTTVVPVPMCQIGDGQVQAHTTPCAELPPSTTHVPVSQLPDGQVQAPSPTPPAPTKAVPPPPPPAATTPTVVTTPTNVTTRPTPEASTPPPAAPPAASTTPAVPAGAAGLMVPVLFAALFAFAAGVLSAFAGM